MCYRTRPRYSKTIKYKICAIVIIIKEYGIQECQDTYKRELQMVIRKLLRHSDWVIVEQQQILVKRGTKGMSSLCSWEEETLEHTWRCCLGSRDREGDVEDRLRDDRGGERWMRKVLERRKELSN